VNEPATGPVVEPTVQLAVASSWVLLSAVP